MPGANDPPGVTSRMTRITAIVRAIPLRWLGALVWLSLATGIPAGWAADPVVLQLRWDHQFQFAGYYAALWQGYYRQAGLAVELRSAVKSDGTILSAIDEVAAGRADFGIGAADILLARERGIPPGGAGCPLSRERSGILCQARYRPCLSRRFATAAGRAPGE